MKRYGYLFEKVADINNIMLAHTNARKGKTHYREVKEVDKDPMKYALNIKKMLEKDTYEVGDYDITTRIVDSGKQRTIYRLDYYPHRIIHHAIIQVLEEIWTKTLIADTYCCIKKRGIHKAANKLRVILREDEIGTKYCLKLDIKKYYPNIDHDILKKIVRKKIKDKKLLRLLDDIIVSADGLPIGNYLSQFLANLYLNGFDHYCKETLRVRYYFRYCDDIVLLSSSKEELRSWLIAIQKYLEKIEAGS